MKKCTKCKDSKPVVEFPNDRHRKDGKGSQCKACKRQYRQDNAKALAEKDKQYRRSPSARYNKYKSSAKYRGFEWDMTLEEFMSFWKEPCIWCDSAIETIGLDRVDPALPYTVNNVEPCCKHCNRMKSDLSSEEFLEHLYKIVNFQERSGS